MYYSRLKGGIMNSDTIIVESEISIAVNKLKNMSENLSASVEEYASIMNKVRDEGICDIKIDAELNEIISKAKAYEAAIANVDLNLKGIIDELETSIEDNKDFSYPYSVMDIISQVLKALF